MPQIIEWDAVGERVYETGVDRGVLYVPDANGDYNTGYAWNGLTAVSESPTGGEANPMYADNIKYLNLLSREDFEATIEAYTFPDEFAQFDGTAEPEPGVLFGQQLRKPFGICYRTLIGSDVNQDGEGYKLHFIYNALATPSERSYSTINESPEIVTFSWDLTTTGILVPGYKPTALVTIDSTKVLPADLTALETILYGDDTGPTEPRMPKPDELLTLMAA